MFFLALEVFHIPVSELEQRLTWDEFLEWSLFFEIHPFGYSWVQHARLESHISTFTCDKPLTVHECMPPYKKKTKKFVPEDFHTKMLAAAKGAGLKIIHKDKKQDGK